MPRNASTWTVEQGRAMGAIGRAALAAKVAKRKAEAREVARIAVSLTDDQSYQLRIIGRTRAQIEGLLDLLDRERTRKVIDGQRLNWLATALEKLTEVERKLAMRPVPGSLKPTQPKERETPRGPALPSLPAPVLPNSQTSQAAQQTVAQPLQPTEPAKPAGSTPGT